MKKYTLEEYKKLKQEVINLRISSTHLAGSNEHAKVWNKLRELEEELENAEIVEQSEQLNKNIYKKTLR